MNLAASPLRSSSLARLAIPLVSRPYYSTMAQDNGTPEAPSNELRKLKILMLHGYTQSGPLFHAKTRALEKILHKAFPPTKISPLHATYPGGVQLSYPTAPMRLQPADIPGFIPANGDEPEKADAWGWWKRETGSGRYTGLEEGLRTIADAIREMGGIDGVIGFSQGAAAAAMVASLLEPGRPDAFDSRFPYPASFADLQHPSLKFAVSYSGFISPNEEYKAFYHPKIATRMLNVIGSLDSVVEESRSLALVEACGNSDSKTVYHPGGHFVPVSKDMASVLVGFIRESCEEKKEEAGIEDMDVPF